MKLMKYSFVNSTVATKLSVPGAAASNDTNFCFCKLLNLHYKVISKLEIFSNIASSTIHTYVQ